MINNEELNEFILPTPEGGDPNKTYILVDAVSVRTIRRLYGIPLIYVARCLRATNGCLEDALEMYKEKRGEYHGLPK